jgi:hypothetical protein
VSEFIAYRGAITARAIVPPPTRDGSWIAIFYGIVGLDVDGERVASGQSIDYYLSKPYASVVLTASGSVYYYNPVSGDRTLSAVYTPELEWSANLVKPPCDPITVATPQASALTDFPTLARGRAPEAPRVTLHDDTASAAVTLGAVEWDGVTGWSAGVPLLVHGHAYTLTVIVPETLAHLEGRADVAFTIPALFPRERTWGMVAGIGPSITKAWRIVAQIGGPIERTWRVVAAITHPSPAANAPDPAALAAALAPIHRFRARLFVRWDGVNWVDETDHLLDASGTEDVDLNLRALNTAQMTVTLDNGDQRYTPTNATSPLAPYLRRIRQAVKLVGGYQGHEDTIFYGLVDSLAPRHNDRTASMRCLDRTATWKKVRVAYGPFGDVRVDEVVDAMLSGAGLARDVDYVLDTCDNRVAYALAANALLLDELQDLARTEGGRLFVNRAGMLELWSRSRALRAQAAPLLTLSTDAHLYDIARSTSPQGLATRVTMAIDTRSPAAESTLYQLGAPITLPRASASWDPLTGQPWYWPGVLTLRLRSMDLTTWERSLPAMFTSVSAFEARNTFDGTALTVHALASLADAPLAPQSSWPDAIYYHADLSQTGLATLTVWGWTAWPAEISALTLLGTPQRPNAPTAVTATDQDAIDAYGDIELQLHTAYPPDAEHADMRVREELALRRDPLARVDIPLQDGLPFLHVFDTVRVEDRSLPLLPATLDVQVLANDWRVNPSEGYTQKLVTGPALPEQWRVLASGAEVRAAAIPTLDGDPAYRWGASAHNLRWGLGQWS